MEQQPTNDSAVAKTDATDKPTSFTLGDLAPIGVNAKLYVQVLKQQLLASKNQEPTNEELLYFAQVCKASGLDPTKKEIYGVYRGGKLTIQTGIDGLRIAAERSGKFGGSKEPEFSYSDENKITVKHKGLDKLVPNKARVTVMKVMGGQVLETTRTANWLDYYPGEQLGTMYRQYPEVMLAKCAEAQALRAAFPNLNQLYVEEEMLSSESVSPVHVDRSKVKDEIANAKARALGSGEEQQNDN
jgi:phage recombination protein Bet